MLVGVDVDGVLADLVGGLAAYVRRYQPDKSFDPTDVTGWEFLDQRFGREQAYALIARVWENWRDYIPLLEPHTKSALRQLHRDGRQHRIVVVTKEGRQTLRHVVAFLDYHLIPYDALVMIGYTGRKLEYPVDCLIDDNPALVEEAGLYPRKTVFLRDQPWNRGLTLPRNVLRVRSVEETVGLLLGEIVI